MGPAEVELVDLPWTAAASFFPGQHLKQPRFKDAAVVQLGGATPWRPNKESVYAAADQWIESAMNPETALEYHTAEEAEEAVAEEVEEAPALMGPAASEDEASQSQCDLVHSVG